MITLLTVTILTKLHCFITLIKVTVVTLMEVTVLTLMEVTVLTLMEVTVLTLMTNLSAPTV